MRRTPNARWGPRPRSSIASARRHRSRHRYFLRARCRDQYDMMLAVLKRIADATEVSDEALGVAVDDAASPPSSAFKSKVIKKTSITEAHKGRLADVRRSKNNHR